MKFYILLIIFLITTKSVFSYTENVNQLIEEINHEMEITGDYNKIFREKIKIYGKVKKNKKLYYFLKNIDPKNNETGNSYKYTFWLLKNAKEEDYNLKLSIYKLISDRFVFCSDYENAIYYLDKATEISKTKAKFYLGHLYNSYGNIYFKQKKYKKAISYFIKAQKTFESNKTIWISSTINNNGLCYKQLGEPEIYFKKSKLALSILLSKKNRNSFEKHFENVLYTNFGDYYFIKKDYDKSLHFYKKALLFFEKYDPDLKSVECIYKIDEIIKLTKNKKLALSFSKYLYISACKEQYSGKQSKLCELLNKNNFYNLNSFQKNKIIQLMEVSEKNHFEIFKRESVSLSKLNSQIIQYLVGKENEQNLILEKYKSKTLRITLISILLVLFIIFIFTYNFQKQRLKLINNKNESINLKNQLIEQDLFIKNERLSKLILNQNIKSEIQKELLDELKKFKRRKSVEPEEIIRQFQLRLSSLNEIDKKTNQNDLSIINFKEKYTNFLKEKYPVLSKSELNMCAYLKLELSAKDISIIEGVNESSVRVYKTRIKNKLNIDAEIKLEDFLHKIHFSV